jgi:hypothetical protein
MNWRVWISAGVLFVSWQAEAADCKQVTSIWPAAMRADLIARVVVVSDWRTEWMSSRGYVTLRVQESLRGIGAGEEIRLMEDDPRRVDDFRVGGEMLVTLRDLGTSTQTADGQTWRQFMLAARCGQAAFPMRAGQVITSLNGGMQREVPLADFAQRFKERLVLEEPWSQQDPD